MKGAPVDDIKIAENPIEIDMPNGVIEKSHAYAPSKFQTSLRN